MQIYVKVPFRICKICVTELFSHVTTSLPILYMPVEICLR